MTKIFLLQLVLILFSFSNVVTAEIDKASESVGSPLRFGGTYRMVNLDEYILQQRPITQGTKVILNPSHLTIAARIKRHPEKRNVEYLYGALRLMQVDPMPQVNYRMFIESDEGQIIPVYVEDSIVSQIEKRIPLEVRVLLKGYHVYNYSKGPALVIESVEAG
ncbi:MAG: hypothetical protein JKY24_03090 [Pseudomonadales bacterium]|nr:hypothetical protein [Pseudomonadales bacterium]